MRPFKIDIADARLQEIRQQVAAFPWHAMPVLAGWDAGASTAFVRQIAEYWVDAFDWCAQEAALNRFPQFIAQIDGVDMHFYHVPSAQPAARPLLLLHGWPGSIFEFLHLLGPLTDPQSYGGDPADAFHVVVPSLPGFGFSGKPVAPIGPAAVARMAAKLMAMLGYNRYIAQGGDWGAIIASLIGYNDLAHCRGIHLNMLVPQLTKPPQSEAEAKWTRDFTTTLQTEGAYGALQRTKPQSLGYAMTDSPLGIAAWILEKFASWSDLPRDAAGEPDLLAVYSRDQLLTNIMIYLAQDSFVTSTWLYRGYLDEMAALPFARAEQCPVPTGFAAFPDPVFAPQPRSMAERNYNLVQWTEMPRGGHFAALEAPGAFLDDVRRFARTHCK